MKPEFITETDWKILKEKYPNHLKEAIEKLENHYPIQYLIGDVDFYNCKIKVDERALIPRYETEFLVEKAINRIRKLGLEHPKIIDLGTGSGCIAIALKKNVNGEVTGVDISKGALTLAKENASLNKVEVKFLEKDMVDIELEDYDIIISNPPYVSKKEPVGIETSYEPQKALFADRDGLYFYEEILKKINRSKQKPVFIAFEIGCQQRKSLEELKEKYLSTYQFEVEKDLANKDRYVFLTKNE